MITITVPGMVRLSASDLPLFSLPESRGILSEIVICLVKYERQPLRFIFKYYKPQNDWRILNFSFDENVDEALEEIMKYD